MYITAVTGYSVHIRCTYTLYIYAVTPELPINMGVGKQAAIQTLWKKIFTRAVFGHRKVKKKRD